MKNNSDFDIKQRDSIFYYTVKYYDGHFETIATKKYTSEIISTLNRSSKIFYLNSIAWMGTYIIRYKSYIRNADVRIIQL